MPPRPPSPRRQHSPQRRPGPTLSSYPTYSPSKSRSFEQLLGKSIDLNSSTRSVDKGTGQRIIKRAFLVDVVVENGRDGVIGKETQALLESLGQPLSYSDLLRNRITQKPSSSSYSRPKSSASSENPKPSGKPNKAKLDGLIAELRETEERYLRRISVLKNSYADPLRTFAKCPDSLIIPLYDAKALFANIDALVLAAEMFSVDLSQVDTTGRVPDRGVGDICLKHLKELGTFDCYRTYYDKQDESQRSFGNMLKRQAFETFTESVKYQTVGIGNIGIRELLAEPVQRIPRYTLLWQCMVDCMWTHDPQRPKLEEAIALASKIASCETDERTRRAMVMYCLERSMEGFPVNLMSNKRDLIDCIDVDDIPPDWRDKPNVTTSPHSGSDMSPSGPSHTNPHALHATLFLFNDKLVIAKRQSSSISGRKVTGLDDVENLVKGGGGLTSLVRDGAGLKRDKLAFRGMVDIMDVMMADVGEGDLQVFMENPPRDQSDKWSNRPFRNYSIVQPPFPPGMDPIGTRTDKERFLRNFWHAQALLRTQTAGTGNGSGNGNGSTQAIVANERSSSEGGDKGPENATTFYNVWSRNAWLNEARKAKIAVQIDDSDEADSLTFARGTSNPTLHLRLQPLAGGICRWQMTARDPEDIPREEELLHTEDVAGRITEAVHKHRLYYFAPPARTPVATPTSFRHRPSMMNLDAISRNLFGSTSVSSKGHTSMTPSQRSKSVISRSSTIDTSRYSVQSRSTAATSVFDDQMLASPEKPLPQINEDRKVILESMEESVSTESFRSTEIVADRSDADLDVRLDLARKNSASASRQLEQAAQAAYNSAENDVSMLDSPRKLQVRNRTPTPEKELPVLLNMPSTFEPTRPLDLSKKKSPPRPVHEVASQQSLSLGRPLPSIHDMDCSPRSLPTPNPSVSSHSRSKSSTAAFAGSSHTKMGVIPGTATESTIALHGGIWAPDGYTIASPSTRGMRVSSGHKRCRSEEDSAPRKRSVDHSPIMLQSPALEDGSSSRTRRPSGTIRTPRMDTPPQGLTDRTVRKHQQARQVSGVTASSADTLIPRGAGTNAEQSARESGQLVKTAISAKEHVTVAMRTARSMKSELKDLAEHLGSELALHGRKAMLLDNASEGLSRSPSSRKLSLRADGSPRSMRSTMPPPPSTPTRSSAGRVFKTDVDLSYMEEWSRSIASLVDQLAVDLERSRALQHSIIKGTTDMETAKQNLSVEKDALNGRLTRSINKYALAQTQITDLKAELEEVYEAFNTELDCMFNDSNLPAEDAFAALQRELQITKAQRNELRLENLKLKTDLQDANLRKEEWTKLLKSHGILG